MDKIWKVFFIVTMLVFLSVVAIAMQTKEGVMVLVKFVLIIGALIAFVMSILYGVRGWKRYLINQSDKKLIRLFYLSGVVFILGIGLKFVHPLIGLGVLILSAMSAGMVSTEEKRRRTEKLESNISQEGEIEKGS